MCEDSEELCEVGSREWKSKQFIYIGWLYEIWMIGIGFVCSFCYFLLWWKMSKGNVRGRMVKELGKTCSFFSLVLFGWESIWPWEYNIQSFFLVWERWKEDVRKKRKSNITREISRWIFNIRNERFMEMWNVFFLVVFRFWIRDTKKTSSSAHKMVYSV